MASPRTNKARRQAKAAGWSSIRSFRADGVDWDEKGLDKLREGVLGSSAPATLLELRELDELTDMPALLMHLHVRDLQAVRKRSFLLPPFGRKMLNTVPVVDALLTQASAGWTFVESSAADDAWASELRRGVDGICRALWLLRSGLTTGAVVVTRRLLERWTFNIASTWDLEKQREDEADEEYISRVWRVYPDLPADVGAYWALLSELLHGRAAVVSGRPISVDAVGSDQLALHNVIVRVLEYPYLQIRGGIRSLLPEDHPAAAFLGVRAGDVPLPTLDELPRVPEAIGPVDFYFVNSELGESLTASARTYRDSVARRPAPSLSMTIEEGQNALLERVGRAVEVAAISFENERQMVGKEFDYGALAARLYRYIAISRMAQIVAVEATHAGSDSIRRAGLALESVWRIWLEDSDFTLPIARVVLEQTAVARTLRLKPAKGAKLESAGAQTGPARWVAAAGWGRLAVFVRALGEFSHITSRSRLGGARSLLEDIQDADDATRARHGARREALDEVAYLLAYEVIDRLETSQPNLAARFRREVTLLNRDEHDARLTDWLERALQLKSAEFGEPDMSTFWP